MRAYPLSHASSVARPARSEPKAVRINAGASAWKLTSGFITRSRACPELVSAMSAPSFVTTVTRPPGIASTVWSAMCCTESIASTVFITPRSSPVAGSSSRTEMSTDHTPAESSYPISPIERKSLQASCHQSSSDCTKSLVGLVSPTLNPLLSVKKTSAKYGEDAIWRMRYAFACGETPRLLRVRNRSSISSTVRFGRPSRTWRS